MDHALLVRRFERLGDLARDRQTPRQPGAPRRDTVGERAAFDELQHERADAVRLLDAVDGADVRVIQRRQHSRFTIESRAPVRIRGED